MKQAEPPSSDPIEFLVGKDSRGHWVAQERTGLYGGLFISRAAAVSYALFENGHNPAAIISTPDVIELQMVGRPAPSPAAASTVDGPAGVRRAA